MLTFLGPGLQPPPSPRPGAQFVHTLESLIEAAYSKLPEHASVRSQVPALNQRSMAIARALGPALPEPLQEFWEAYAGWFAMYSVSPLLANAEVGRQAVSESAAAQVIIRENWRAAGWWSGRDVTHAALVDLLSEASREVAVHPPGLWQALRRPVALLVAARQANQALEAEACNAAAHAGVEAGATEVLWLSVGASSADLLARLSKAGEEQLGLRSAVVDFNYFGSEAALSRQGVEYASIAQFVDAEALRTGREAARQADRGWRAIAAAVQRERTFAELPAGWREAILSRLRLVLRRDAPQWVVQGAAARKALEAYRPAAVVGTHVYGPPIAPMVVAARRRGIPRICLQHGVIGPRYLALPCLPYDEQLLFGSYAAEILGQVCGPETALTVTGHCLYDEATSRGEVSPEVAPLRENTRAMVLLCTQFNEHMYYRPGHWWMAEVAQACRDLGARLVLKLHPSDSAENITRYETLLRPGDDTVVVAPHGKWPLPDLLAACDVMVTRDSTVVFEANLFDKPAVTVNLSQWDEELPYADTGGALGVYEYSEIAPALRSVVCDPEVRSVLAQRREQFLLAHVGPRDGRATERIVAAIARHARTSD